MKGLSFYLLIILLSGFYGASIVPSPFVTEICDNAMDDDSDGLIDLNDPDCDCPLAVPESLIPNPSFEETSCCATDRSQLNCANGWIQASEATTDLLNTCGWMGWPDLPPPLPFPDGNKAVGWRNGRAGGGGNPNWKEYAGACLKGPLKAGTSYRFEFWVGFTYAVNSPPTNIVFYGSQSCTNLPFGKGNERFGCPTNGPGWIELGKVDINGINQWKLYNITVTPSKDIHAIAIGPDCIEVPPVVNTYYFFDNLILAAQSEFIFNIEIKGHPCSRDMTLEVAAIDTMAYQWYRNGIALIGETNAKLKNTAVEGDYQVRVKSSKGCVVSKPFSLKIPAIRSSRSQLICNGDSYLFNGSLLFKSGIYADTLKSVNNCDSIIQLNLNVLPDKVDTVNALIFEGESYQVGLKRFSSPGTYETLFKSNAGCDSLVILNLNYFDFYFPTAFSPNGDGLNDVFTIYAPNGVSEISALQIFDRWGGTRYRVENLRPGDFHKGWDGTDNGRQMHPGLYLFKAVIQFHDGRSKTVSGPIHLIR
jgi:gliding motility-associated-like protein